MKHPPVGRKKWAIPEGYIPPYSHGEGRDFVSHDAICMLNASEKPAEVQITVFFTDREPVGPYLVSIGPRRSKHLRFNELESPEPIPKNVDFSSLIESDIPIVVQHTRLDSRQAETALMTTMAFPCD